MTGNRPLTGREHTAVIDQRQRDPARHRRLANVDHFVGAPRCGPLAVRASMALLNGSNELWHVPTQAYPGAGRPQAERGRQAAQRGDRVAGGDQGAQCRLWTPTVGRTTQPGTDLPKSPVAAARPGRMCVISASRGLLRNSEYSRAHHQGRSKGNRCRVTSL